MKKLYTLLTSSLLVAITFLSLSVSAQNTFYGNIFYHGDPTQPIPGITVSMSNPDFSFTAEVITDQDGFFTINNIPAGTFTVTAETTLSAGGIDLADAYLVMLHLFNLLSLDDYQAAAADVNANGFIDWGDYWDILIGWIMYSNPFQNDEWLFDTQEITFQPVKDGGTTIGSELGATCTGDINGTWIPDEKSSGTYLLNNETVTIFPGETRDITFTASNTLTVAGLYIGIQYNPAVLTIQGYETTPEAMEYNTIETPGLLGFHWMTNPQMELLTLKKNDPVITLTVTVAENATPQTITFTLDEESNYISASGKTLKSNPLFAQSLEVLKNENTTTINETSDRVSLYPNPASEYLIVGTHNLNQKIVIHDMTGKTVCDASLTTLQTRLNVSSFKPGYYFYQIINKDDGTIDHSGKLAVTR